MRFLNYLVERAFGASKKLLSNFIWLTHLWVINVLFLEIYYTFQSIKWKYNFYAYFKILNYSNILKSLKCKNGAFLLKNNNNRLKHSLLLCTNLSLRNIIYMYTSREERAMLGQN